MIHHLKYNSISVYFKPNSLYLLLSFALQGIVSFSQSPDPKEYSPIKLMDARDGLSENKITHATIDLNGLYWFATAGEINRWGGNGFHSFPMLDAQGIAYSGIAYRTVSLSDHRFLLYFSSVDLSNIAVFQYQTGVLHPISQNYFKNRSESAMTVLVDEHQNAYFLSRTLAHDSVRMYYFHPQGYFQEHLQLPHRDTIRYYGSEVNRNQAYCVAAGYVWYLSNGQEIKRISPESGQIKEYPGFFEKENWVNWKPSHSSYFIISGNKHLYLADPVNGFLYGYDCTLDHWIKLSKLPRDVVFHETDEKGNLAFVVSGSFQNHISRLYFFDSENARMTEVQSLPTKYLGVIAHDFLKQFFAYGYHGIAQYRIKESKVKTYLTHEQIYKDKAQEDGLFPIRGIGQMSDSLLIVSTTYKDIQILNLKIGKHEEGPFYKDNTRIYISDDFSKIVVDDSGHFWIDKNSSLVKAHFFNRNLEYYFKEIYDFVPGEKGAWYLSAAFDRTRSDLYYWQQDSAQAENLTGQVPDEKNRMSGTSVLYKDKQGLLWIGQKDGVELFDPKTKKFKSLKKWNGKTGSQVSCIEQTEDGLFWFGSLGNGLFRYDPLTGAMNQYGRAEGLPNQKIASILADGINLWVASYDGLAYYFKNKNSFVKFYKEDGLSHNEFNRRSFCRLSDGRFVFGTINGINIFKTEDLLGGSVKTPNRIKPIQISHYEGPVLKRYRLNAEKITSLILPPSNRYCDFEFSLTGRSADHPVQLSYRVDGVHKQWNYTNQSRIEMPWLPSGQHLLRVRGADLMGDWSEEYTIKLEVQQYFYQSSWFLVLVSLMILLAIFKYQRLNYYRKLEHLSAVQFKQLHDMKSRFFSYITHEFRTPLTLIMGYARFGEESNLNESGHFKKIGAAGERLLDLVNQMLDLAKAESGQMQVKPRKGPLVQFITDCYTRIQPLAERKNIRFRFQSNCDEWYCLFDPDILQKIVENLLTNAIKFTPEHGDVHIKLHLGKDQTLDSDACVFYELTVQDNGPGLSEAESKLIFEPFYQSDQNRSQSGTGLGLSLVRELVELSGGQLTLVSKPGEGSSFRLRFLLEESSPANDPQNGGFGLEQFPDSQPDVQNAEIGEITDNPENLVLIVEDNPEIAEYIEKCLQDQYRCFKAADGLKGFEMACRIVPDLIVSDIMMPGMDGFDLLKKLKSDPISSHIPVVLLTAKVQVADRIKGLSIGANAYLPKPFDPTELQLTVRNLFQLRKEWTRRYQNPSADSDSIPASPVENSGLTPVEIQYNDRFYLRLCELIRERIAESELDNETLCKEMGMSKSQLHRKVTALTGEPPVRLIRTLRLKHAENLLLNQPNLSVSEIAYASGFNSPAYFTRVFQSEKGMSPSEFREKHN